MKTIGLTFEEKAKTNKPKAGKDEKDPKTNKPKAGDEDAEIQE